MKSLRVILAALVSVFGLAAAGLAEGQGVRARAA
jgi:hypothetical protein